jgi:hypothetical protein
MTDGDAYGGYAWYQQWLDALNAAAAQNISLADLLGYYQQGYEPAQEPTEEEALDAIWAARPDIGDAGNLGSREAIRRWLATTSEIGEGESRNAVDFAKSRGLVEATPEVPGEEVPTLAREVAEANQEYDSKVLDLEQAKLDLEKELRLGDREFQLALQEADNLVDLKIHGETLAFEQAKQAFQEKYQLEEFEWTKFIDTKMLELQVRQLEQTGHIEAEKIAVAREQLGLERYQTDVDVELKNRELDIQQSWNQGQLSLAERAQTLQERAQEYEQLTDQRDYLRQLGLDEEAIRQWEAEHGLDEKALALQEALGMGELGLGGRELDIKEQLGQGELGLGYLNLLGSLRGPNDWMQYWNVQRNAENTQLPAWASALMGNVQQTPAFQGAGTGTMGVQGAPSGGGIQLQPVGGGQAQQNFANMGQPFVQGHQVTPAQWNTLNPSEQAGLQSVIEFQGGYAPDWIQNMMRAAPKVPGGGGGGSYFQGW